MYKKQAACSLGVLGQRLVEQEEDFAGRAASYQTEIQHLQRLLGDKQQDLDGVLQQKRYQSSQPGSYSARETGRQSENQTGSQSERQ